MIRSTYHYAGAVEALSPISHLGSQRGGTVTTLNRRKFVQRDRTVEEVPIVSGNSWRGQIRDAGMRWMLEATGITVSLPEFHLLFSGGMLSKGDAPANIRTGDYRRLRELVPLLSVLGGAVGGQIMAGKLRLNREIIPICAETLRALPPEAVPEGPVPSIYDLLEIVEFTRSDNAKQETFRHLMEPASVALLEGEAPPKSDLELQTQQMRYGSEVFATGTEFWLDFTLEHVTNLEREAFLSAVLAWAQRPTLGGKSSIGLGLVRVRLNEMTLERTATAANGLAFELGVEYREHLRANVAEIAELLRRMAA